MMSAPASSQRRIWSIVAPMSSVGVLVIVCTLIGAVGFLHFTWTGPLHFVATRWILWLNHFTEPEVLPLYAVETLGGRPLPLTPTSAMAIGYVAVFASVLAYLSFNRIVALLGPNTAGLAVHLVPVFGTILEQNAG